MRVFVAGASGAIGLPLVRQLVAAGHEVTGTTRRHDRARLLAEMGAQPVVVDALDEPAVLKAVWESAPEVVVHQLTALPAALKLRRRDIFAATNRIRREGTRNLVSAAQRTGVRRLVAQSIAFVYAPVGSWVKAEDAPLWRDPPAPFAEVLRAVCDLEDQVNGADGLERVVLRYGFFYGPGTAYALDGYFAHEVRRRRFPVVGDGAGHTSFVHVHDAATATVAAIQDTTVGTFNITDDEPAPQREWLPTYAAALDARPPRRVPPALARVVAGPAPVALATTLRGASNALAKRTFHMRLRFPTWREGFLQALE